MARPLMRIWRLACSGCMFAVEVMAETREDAAGRFEDLGWGKPARSTLCPECLEKTRKRNGYE